MGKCSICGKSGSTTLNENYGFICSSCQRKLDKEYTKQANAFYKMPKGRKPTKTIWV